LFFLVGEGKREVRVPPEAVAACGGRGVSVPMPGTNGSGIVGKGEHEGGGVLP